MFDRIQYEVGGHDREREIQTLRRLDQIERLLERILVVLEKELPPETYNKPIGISFKAS